MEAIVNLIQVLNDKCSILLFFWKNTDYLFLSFSGGRVLPAEVELVRLQTEDGHQQRDQCSWVQPVSSGDPEQSKVEEEKKTMSRYVMMLMVMREQSKATKNDLDMDHGQSSVGKDDNDIINEVKALKSNHCLQVIVMKDESRVAKT